MYRNPSKSKGPKSLSTGAALWRTNDQGKEYSSIRIVDFMKGIGVITKGMERGMKSLAMARSIKDIM